MKLVEQLVGEPVLLAGLRSDERSEIGRRNAVASLERPDMTVLQTKGRGCRPNPEPVDDFGE